MSHEYDDFFDAIERGENDIAKKFLDEGMNIE